MRLTFILSSLSLGGGNRVVVEYANRLTQRGHVVSLVYPHDSADPLLQAEINQSVQQCPSVQPLPKTASSFKNAQLAWSLARAVPHSDFVIATHTPTTLSSFIATKLLRKGRALWLFQDYAEMFVGRSAESWLLRNGLRWHMAALAVSQPAMAELRRYAVGSVIFVGEGLSHADLLYPNPRDSADWSPPFSILYVGDARPRKGLNDFLTACEQVYTELPINLHIVSKEPITVETNAVPATIHIKPDTVTLTNLYRNCDLFVSSSWKEGFGLPPLEAMACGAPVVATDSGGIQQYAQDGENCLVVPIKQPAKLAAAISRVLTSADLAQHLSQNGLATAAQYDWPTAVDRFESTLQSLI